MLIEMTINILSKMNHSRTPINVCRNCGYRQDSATAIEQGTIPKKGDVSLCFKCGILSVYEKDLRTRQPTEDEMVAIIEDEEGWELIQRAQRIIANREHTK